MLIYYICYKNKDKKNNEQLAIYKIIVYILIIINNTEKKESNTFCKFKIHFTILNR